MNKTKIEWCDYTSNPVKGYCPNACPYCYARAMYDRFGWDKTIRLEPAELDTWPIVPPGSKVFVGSTIDLFGPWIQSEWLADILSEIRMGCDHATFIFLTKFPENLSKWHNWPDNAWVGATATDYHMGHWAVYHLLSCDARVKFISFEPLLGSMTDPEPEELWKLITARDIVVNLDWVIIGAQTGRGPKPPLSDVHRWAQEIIDAADSEGIPVFLKDNLQWPVQRREFPRVRGQ